MAKKKAKGRSIRQPKRTFKDSNEALAVFGSVCEYEPTEFGNHNSKCLECGFSRMASIHNLDWVLEKQREQVEERFEREVVEEITPPAEEVEHPSSSPNYTHITCPTCQGHGGLYVNRGELARFLQDKVER